MKQTYRLLFYVFFLLGLFQMSSLKTPSLWRVPEVKAQSGTGPTAGCPGGTINTAFGCIVVETTQGLVITFVRIGLGLAGGTAFILIVYAGFMIMTSSGDPKKLAAGKELLTAAIGGLIFLILGAYFLNVVGTDILGIFS